MAQTVKFVKSTTEKVETVNLRLGETTALANATPKAVSLDKTVGDIVREYNYSGVVSLNGMPINDPTLTLRDLGVRDGDALTYAKKNGGNLI